jgi:dGTPase
MSAASNAESPPLPGRTFAEREALLLAPYAMASAATRGRRHPEPAHPYRGPFQRDRDRIVHCAAYRRLAHKTQVFTGDMGDYHRTRLTHTLEVASVARTIGRALALNEDLIEALALLHDLGHPPFGHAGEDTLDACVADDGGFDHNTHALRIVEHLETRYQNFPGLNLSLEVLEGQASRASKADAAHRPLLEVQVVEAADSIAYDAHDADDAIQLGLLSLDELLEIPWWREAVGRVRETQCSDADDRLRQAVVHELIDWQVGDILETATKNLAAEGVAPAVVPKLELGNESSHDRTDALVVVRPSEALAKRKRELEAFLSERVYRHPRVLTMRDRAQAALAAMFDGFVRHPERLPASFHDRIERVGVRRSACDYVAGMTDRFALAQYSRLFNHADWSTELTEAPVFGA